MGTKFFLFYFYTITVHTMMSDLGAIVGGGVQELQRKSSSHYGLQVYKCSFRLG
jgi:hypothetical protein